MERILVLGSNSFSGATFVDFALNQGLEVFGVSRSPEYPTVFLPYKNNSNISKFRFEQADLNLNLDKIISLTQDFRPDYFINFAAQSMVAESWQNPDHWYTTNVVGNVRLHEALRKMSFLKKYVHVSTPEVYGTCSGNIKESTSFNPSTPYAASRAACDLHLQTFIKNYKFPVIFTRAANVFGPGQQLYRIVPRAILFAKLGKKLQLHGGGHSVRSFIHGQDVADGTLRAARNGKLGDVFHLSTARQISIRSFVEMICDRLSIKFNDFVQIVDDRPGKDSAYLLDSTKAHNDLHWKPSRSLESGLEETIQWINNNFEELKKLPFDYFHKP